MLMDFESFDHTANGREKMLSDMALVQERSFLPAADERRGISSDARSLLMLINLPLSGARKEGQVECPLVPSTLRKELSPFPAAAGSFHFVAPGNLSTSHAR